MWRIHIYLNHHIVRSLPLQHEAYRHHTLVALRVFEDMNAHNAVGIWVYLIHAMQPETERRRGRKRLARPLQILIGGEGGAVLPMQIDGYRAVGGKMLCQSVEIVVLEGGCNVADGCAKGRIEFGVVHRIGGFSAPQIVGIYGITGQGAFGGNAALWGLGHVDAIGWIPNSTAMHARNGRAIFRLVDRWVATMRLGRPRSVEEIGKATVIVVPF